MAHDDDAAWTSPGGAPAEALGFRDRYLRRTRTTHLIYRVVVGIVGTVLPALPGTILVLAGIVLAAWIDDFTRIKWWVVAIVSVLALLAWATDYVATIMGAKKAGASKLAIVGAALGTIAGIFMGLIG